MVNGEDTKTIAKSENVPENNTAVPELPSLKDLPPKFVQNFYSRSHQFSKLDNKYAHKSCGEFLGSSGHGLKRQPTGARLHRSDNIISWNNPVQSESYMSRTKGTYTAPPVPRDEIPKRRFKRQPPPATSDYKLSTTTSCWNPDPNFKTMYKVLAETQHRLNKPNSWNYSTHSDHRSSDLRKHKFKC